MSPELAQWITPVVVVAAYWALRREINSRMGRMLRSENSQAPGAAALWVSVLHGETDGIGHPRMRATGGELAGRIGDVMVARMDGT